MVTKSFGNWVYDRVLGSGGFGQVELWKEKFTDKKIAIKRCMLPDDDITPKQAMRWKNEIFMMQNFQHPNIVKAIPLPDVISFESSVLCMEFCNKGNLRKLINEPGNACGLVEKEVLSVMKDISSALKYLHYNSITHRDLKPENVVLHEKNNMIIYKLIDLGFAKELGNKTATASLVGTFNYAAPELFLSNKYTSSIDYWSMGILFFEVLTGYKPFIPQKQNLFKWLHALESKRYDDIWAQEIDGEIILYDNLIHANDLSDYILNKLVEWFKISLQWNPKKRGKRPGSAENVFFTVLKEVFPKMTIHIFSVNLYRVDRYNINSNVTLVELQQWIEQKTKIPVNEQVIANTHGKILSTKSKSGTLLFQDIPNSILYVYNNESLEVTKFDCDWKMPSIINVMLMNPDEIKEKVLLRQCYTSLIYIMRYEVNLFKQYIFALGTKYDIIQVQIKKFYQILLKGLADVESLLNQVKETLKSHESSDVKKSLVDLMNKIENLYKAFNKIKSDIDGFDGKFRNFFSSEKLLKNLKKYETTYEYFLSIFSEFETKRLCSHEYIQLQIDSLQERYGQFDEEKEKLLKDEETVTFLRDLHRFEKSFHSYMKGIEAGTELLPSYKKKLSELLTTTASDSVILDNDNQKSQSLVKNDDTEIKDNIVLLSLFNEYLKSGQENWSRVKSDFEKLEL